MQTETVSNLTPELSRTLSLLLLRAQKSLRDQPSEVERCLHQAVNLLSSVAGPKSHPDAIAIGGLPQWRIRRVREFIQGHIDKPLSAADLAAATGLSPSRFARAFKISFGVSPHQHLMKARIDRAKLLMLTTDDGLSSIASACGLSDQSHFSRLFQRFEGETPTSWRRRLGNAVTWQTTTNRAARLVS